MSILRTRLAGKVAIVTGAGTSGTAVGTGRAAAILFAREGAKVVLADSSLPNAELTLEAIEEEGGTASVFSADVTKTAECRALVDAAVERYGGLHILFNNVGIHGPGSVTDFDEDFWDTILTVNLKSMALMSKYAVPAMAETGGGSIINVSSIDGMRAGMSRNVPYAAAKGGVISLTKCMAVHHGRQGIRVNCISPGHIHGAMVDRLVNDDTRRMRRQAAPLGIEGNAWDIAWTAVFLASDEARFISGIVVPVDGGLLATTPLSALPFFAEDPTDSQH